VSSNFEKFSDPSRKIVSQEPPRKKPAKSFLSRRVAFRLGGLVVGLLIYLLVANLIYQSFVVKTKEQQLLELTKQRAQLTAENIESYIDSLRSKIEFYASQPRIANAITGSEKTALSEASDNIKGTLDHAVYVRFIPLETIKNPEPEAVPPIRFSEMQMIAAAEQRGEIIPEVAKVAQSAFLNFVAPIPNDSSSPVVGTVMISFDTRGLAKQLEKNNARLGRVSLLQQYENNKPMHVTHVGESDFPVSETATVNDSHFVIKFEPSKGLAAQTHADLLMVSIVIGVCAVLFLVVGYFGGSLIGKIVLGSEEAVTKNNVEGGVVSNYPKSAAAAQAPDDILDIELSEEDQALLGLSEESEVQNHVEPVQEEPEEEDILANSAKYPDEVFRAYDIRGKAETQITNNLAHKVGQAVASEAMDGGFKIVIDGNCRSEGDIKAIRKRILSGKFYQGAGEEHRHDIVPEYIDTIFSDVALAGDINVVIDAGNAVAGTVAPRLFEELGCQVNTLYCELDGNFPNHNPDPSVPENLNALIEKVKELGADLGVAFDGDGDRLAVVTPKGKIIWPDRLLMLYARDIVSRNPGADVVFDVKSTRHLSKCIIDVGGRPVMWKTGHSPMKAKIQETGALLGGEYSGHIFIKDRWYGFDDGLYAAARLIEIISLQGQDLDSMFEELPESISTPEIRVPVDESRKFEIVKQLVEQGDFSGAKITTIDGLRADFTKGWGLVRASNTGAELTLRFEAESEEFLHQLKSLFVRELRKIDKTINIEWEK